MRKLCLNKFMDHNSQHSIHFQSVNVSQSIRYFSTALCSYLPHYSNLIIASLSFSSFLTYIYLLCISFHQLSNQMFPSCLLPVWRLWHFLAGCLYRDCRFALAKKMSAEWVLFWVFLVFSLWGRLSPLRNANSCCQPLWYFSLSILI